MARGRKAKNAKVAHEGEDEHQKLAPQDDREGGKEGAGSPAETPMNKRKYHVKPIAPDDDDDEDDGAEIESEEAVDSDEPIAFVPGTFMWAAFMLEQGHSVKRRGWIGNKFVSLSHERIVLAGDDFTAGDWRLVGD